LMMAPAAPSAFTKFDKRALVVAAAGNHNLRVR
jgi:hypothetical protein